MSTVATAQPVADLAAPKKHIRLEIEGLRFLAVFLVVIYHVWLGRVSGGVDIFLLISAFLLTGQFLRKAERGQDFGLGKHWLHLAKRLLPIAVLVISFTVLGSWLLIPADRWKSIMSEAWSSLFYFENWTLANNAVDYYGNHSSASPFQHFWSLSIQGQVFILWPLIILGVTILARRLGKDIRVALLIVFSAIFVLSLAFSIWQTNVNQAYAYFDLFTRLWEFALGSLLALALPYLTLPRVVRMAMGWVGVALIIACGLVLEVDQQFPGYLALWPTIAAAMVIVAGNTRDGANSHSASRSTMLPGSGWGVDRVLAAKPLVFMGGNSYALYLWHWPLLVFLLLTTDKEVPPFWTGVVLIAVACVLAVLSTRFVERPLRQMTWDQAKWYRSVPVVAAALVIAAAPTLVWTTSAQAQIQQTKNAPAQLYPGADYLTQGPTAQLPRVTSLKPAPADLPNQFAHLGTACSGQWKASEALVQKNCTVYTPNVPITRTVAVVGSSHSEQWLPALQYVADQNGWQLISLYKGGCPYSFSTPGLQTDCNIYNGQVSDYLNEKRPNAVFMVGTDNKPSSNAEELQAGFEQTVQDLINNDMDVLAVRDNPRFSFNMAECVITKGANNPQCNPTRESVLPKVSPYSTLNQVPSRLHLLDLSDALCTSTTCPGTVGNMFVYMDDNHVTADYSATMGKTLNEQIARQTGWFAAA